MPLSTFDGEPVVEVHKHYTPDGTLTGVTEVIRPSPWTDRDRALALALADMEANECKRCGGDLRETLDSRWRWIPAEPLVCHRCLALQQAERKHRDDPWTGAMLHVVRKAENPFWHLRHSLVDGAETP